MSGHMELTIDELGSISESLGYAIEEIHTRIGACPDVVLYAEDIEELKDTKKRVSRT